LNPATPLASVEHILEDVDLVLLMTVDTGSGGQSFSSSVLPKIKALRSTLKERGLNQMHIEVDGGVNEQTAALVAEAGADVLVAGSAVFGRSDRKAAIEAILKSAGA